MDDDADDYDRRHNEWVAAQAKAEKRLPPWILAALLKRPVKQENDSLIAALRRIEMILLQIAVGLFPREDGGGE